MEDRKKDVAKYRKKEEQCNISNKWGTDRQRHGRQMDKETNQKNYKKVKKEEEKDLI